MLTYLLAKMTQPSASSILTLLRSFEFRTDPSKNSTCVKCLLKRASSSRFGGIQWRKITSTLTSSRSLCKKSLRKYDTDSKVIWPQTFIGWIKFQVQRVVERHILEYGIQTTRRHCGSNLPVRPWYNGLKSDHRPKIFKLPLGNLRSNMWDSTHDL